MTILKSKKWLIIAVLLTASLASSCAHKILTRNDYAPVQLAYVDFRILRGKSLSEYGKKIGQYDFKLFGCTRRDSKDIKLDSGRALRRNMHFFDTFFEGMNQFYPVVTAENSPYFIYSDAIKDPEYLLVAEISDLFLNVCDHYDWRTKSYADLRSGRAEITVTWRLLDLTRHHTFWKSTSKGYGEILDPVKNGEVELVEKAFADALERMRHLPGFEEALSQRRSPKQIAYEKEILARIDDEHRKAREKAYLDERERLGGEFSDAAGGGNVGGWIGDDAWRGEIVIDPVKPCREMNAYCMYRIRTGVVGVENAQGYMGSGLLIAPEFILTADSVVAKNATVTTHTINNRHQSAETIRRNPKRDVALLHREATEFNPVPLRLDLPEVGEEVFFALGAPSIDVGEGALNDNGIIVGYRYAETGVEIMVNTYVQERTLGGALIDKQGNILGMAHSGPRIVPSELDYFIPIADALQKLGVSIKGVEFPQIPERRVKPTPKPAPELQPNLEKDFVGEKKLPAPQPEYQLKPRRFDKSAIEGMEHSYYPPKTLRPNEALGEDYRN